MKVFLVNDSTSNPNWGDRAAATALKMMLSARGAELCAVLSEDDLKWTKYHVSSIPPQRPNGKRLQRVAELFLPPIVAKLAAMLSRELSNFRVFDKTLSSADDLEICANYFQRHRAEFPILNQAIESCDAVVIHGDGAMVGDGRLPRSQLFIAYLAKRVFSKPVALVNHTADFDHDPLRAMARIVYPMLDDVLFRDITSVLRCNEFVAGEYAADTAFLFEPADPRILKDIHNRPTYYDVWPDEANFDPARPYICIGGSSKKLARGPEDLPMMVDQFTRLVSAIRSTYSGQVVLTTSAVRDEKILRPVAHRLGLPLVGNRISVQQAVDIVGNAEAYIGGRWHPSIFALRGGVPLVPLSSKTFKIDALVEMAGLNTPVFDVMDLDNNTAGILEQLGIALGEGKEERERRKNWARQQADSCWNNVRMVWAVSGWTRTQ